MATRSMRYPPLRSLSGPKRHTPWSHLGKTSNSRININVRSRHLESIANITNGVNEQRTARIALNTAERLLPDYYANILFSSAFSCACIRSRVPAWRLSISNYVFRMRIKMILIPVFLGLLLPQVESSSSSFDYPKARKSDQVDDYHGTKVADPYRWLENPDSPESRAWIEAENKITFDYLKTIPEREKIRQRLTDLWNYERYGVPFKEGGRYFITRNDGLQNQSVLYTMASLKAEPKLLLDPNKLSKDGTVALKGYAISEDGEHMAYGLSSAGSDWEEWRVRKVANGEDTDDVLKWVKFSGASWTKDGKGFFYSRYDEPKESEKLQSVNYYQKLFYHRLGTPQSEDVLVYHRPDQKEWGFDGDVTEDGKYLVITVRQGTDVKNRVFYKELNANSGAKELAYKTGSPVVELLNDFDASYNFVGNDGRTFWFLSDLNAPRGKLIAIDTAKPARDNWKTLIPESKDT